MLQPVPQSSVFSETDAERFAQRRTAIDLIATTRARAIRTALIGNCLFRVNPLGPEPEDTRTNWLLFLREQYDEIARSAELVQGSDPRQLVPDWVCTWIGEHGAENPDLVCAFTKIRDLTHAVLLAAETEDIQKLNTTLELQMQFGRGSFFDNVTEFCDGLWAGLDASRHKEIEQATAAGKAIANTLSRLEQIGKHVRLVSLNASVEASRVGDAGRGLGVIAVEFKTLAEEIQLLATTARTDITAMTGTTKADHMGNSTHKFR